MRLRILGNHNIETRDSRHTCFLADGRLAIDAGSLASGLTGGEIHQLEAVLLTHSHFDHVRDIPSIGLAMLHQERPVEIWGLEETLGAIQRHLLNGTIYPNFVERLGNNGPSVILKPVVPNRTFRVLTYDVLAIPVEHPVPCVGFIIKADDGGCIGYTGDTGGCLLPFLDASLLPEILCIDLSFPNRFGQLARTTGHLTPDLLGRELMAARSKGLDLPRLVAVHRTLDHEAEVLEDLTRLVRELNIDLIPGTEGQELVSVGG